ncbi:hypothetical protein [Dyadobacter sp. CY351]|uniref:hypothetical protein n=1 Tax=Dyadobacter sp. CY351 TaxID=2909337 RepID=UPI001F3DEA02|nr:hypothetical protein [Dyadobacter sp. CY351]MCF2516734.1 hypothetical protein [Dyadobacter sp. CY351]
MKVPRFDKQADSVSVANSTEESVTTDSLSVFIAGAINVANNKWNACYWKNDTLHNLDQKHSIAYDLSKHDSKIIVAGEHEGKPCYWEDGNLNVIDNKRNGKVQAIGSYNGKLYLVGSVYEDNDNFRAFVWKDGVMTFLNNHKGYASDISFRGNDIFISGMDSEKPCFWKNGERTFLSDKFGHGYGIETTAFDVYVVGEYRPTNGGYFLAGYWKNGIFISPTGNTAYILNFGVRENVVYLLGSKYLGGEDEKAVVIRGSETTILDGGHSLSQANDIAFNGRDEYVLGSRNHLVGKENYSNVCYWINNKQRVLKTPYQSQGSAIFLEKLLN